MDKTIKVTGKSYDEIIKLAKAERKKELDAVKLKIGKKVYDVIGDDEQKLDYILDAYKKTQARSTTVPIPSEMPNQ